MEVSLALILILYVLGDSWCKLKETNHTIIDGRNAVAALWWNGSHLWGVSFYPVLQP